MEKPDRKKPTDLPAGLPDVEAIRAAHRRIRDHIHHTPLLSSRFFSERSGARVYLKAENLQRAGSFKIRGALNAVLRAREEGRLGARGVLTYSSGNHGQGVALAAGIAGCPALVVAPTDILPVKKAAIEGYGARVVLCGLTTEDRRKRGEELAAETGALVIPPFDHPDVIAGQGTLALEIAGDLPEVEAIIAPVGGGGLIAGISLLARGLLPGTRVFGAEPETADSMRRSLESGRPVTIPPSRSIADGLRAVRPGDLCFAAVEACVEAVWLVSDAAILAAQEDLSRRAKLVVEPSGATSLAALLEHREAAGLTAVAVLSGGNAEN